MHTTCIELHIASFAQYAVYIHLAYQMALGAIWPNLQFSVARGGTVARGRTGLDKGNIIGGRGVFIFLYFIYQPPPTKKRKRFLVHNHF